MYEPAYPPSYGLNSTITFLLGELLRYSIANNMFFKLLNFQTNVLDYDIVVSVSGRSVNVSRKYCPEVKSLGVGAQFCIAVDIANFGGDVKSFLCVAY